MLMVIIKLKATSTMVISRTIERIIEIPIRTDPDKIVQTTKVDLQDM